MICEKCGAEFVCDLAEGRQACWCFNKPSVMPVGSNCLCPKCLDMAINDIQHPQKPEQATTKIIKLPGSSRRGGF